MFTRQEHSIDQMTAVWLLPVVAAEVAAASGGLLAPHLAGAAAPFTMLITSYVLWAYSVPVAFGILAILMLRMALHKLPHESMAASSWLALGPIGTGALGMLVLGADAPAIFAAHGMASVGAVAQGIGVIGGAAALGVRPVVAAAGGADHRALLPRRHAVQPRLVGLHLPARRLCGRDTQARDDARSRRSSRSSERPRRGAGGDVGGRRGQDAPRRLEGPFVRVAVLQASTDRSRNSIGRASTIGSAAADNCGFATLHCKINLGGR